MEAAPTRVATEKKRQTYQKGPRAAAREGMIWCCPISKGHLIVDRSIPIGNIIQIAVISGRGIAAVRCMSVAAAIGGW